MSNNRLLFFIILGFIFSACVPPNISFSGPNPVPRDITSPRELSAELAQVRIPEREGEGEEEKGYYMRLDGSSRIEALGCGVLSPSERYLACTPNFAQNTIEWIDRETGEHRVLVQKEDAFPTALMLGYPSFSPDEQVIIFNVIFSDNSDMAIVNINSGEIDYMYAPERADMDPIISPDGHWILTLCASNQPYGGGVLCLLDRESNKRFHLVDEALNIMWGSRFTPDSQSVVYVAPMKNEGLLYRIDIDDKEKHLLVSGLFPTDIVLGVTSEDVVFSCRFPEHPGCSWVCVVGLDGSDVRRLTYLGESCIDINAP